MISHVETSQSRKVLEQGGVLECREVCWSVIAAQFPFSKSVAYRAYFRFFVRRVVFYRRLNYGRQTLIMY